MYIHKYIYNIYIKYKYNIYIYKYIYKIYINTYKTSKYISFCGGYQTFIFVNYPINAGWQL